MNIDYCVRNSIYCTLAARALSAAQLLNGPSHARLTRRATRRSGDVGVVKGEEDRRA
jgi:hypothetical protein